MRTTIIEKDLYTSNDGSLHNYCINIFNTNNVVTVRINQQIFTGVFSRTGRHCPFKNDGDIKVTLHPNLTRRIDSLKTILAAMWESDQTSCWLEQRLTTERSMWPLGTQGQFLRSLQAAFKWHFYIPIILDARHNFIIASLADWAKYKRQDTDNRRVRQESRQTSTRTDTLCVCVCACVCFCVWQIPSKSKI